MPTQIDPSAAASDPVPVRTEPAQGAAGRIPTAQTPVDLAVARRKLVIHDSLAFLTLVTVTVVLFAITLFLFQSFTTHRQDLALRWSQRGSAAIQAGKPDQAIVALRTALSYAPGTKAYELLLAQALGEAGHTDESYNYFMGLWETEPGDGFTNLQLARLSAKMKKHDDAVNFYRASIYGTWEGDGVVRRTEVRLELARYLIAEHSLPAARMELLIAGGNTPDSPDFDVTLGGLLEQADDTTDARSYYQKALMSRPDDRAALEASGRLAYQSGDYVGAEDLLAHAVRVPSRSKAKSESEPDAGRADVKTLLANVRRILELMPSRTLPARERVERIIADRNIAARRFNACKARFTGSETASETAHLPAPLQELNTRWTGPDGTANAQALARDPDLQDSAIKLVYDTEADASMICSAATGDDALLLLLASSDDSDSTPPSATEETKR